MDLVAGLLALLLSGVLVTTWVLYYTDWFPLFGGVLALSGGFAWIALLAQLMTDKRKEELREHFETRIVLSQLPWLCLLGVAVLLLLATAFTTTLTVQSYRDPASRSITISRENGVDGLSQRLQEVSLPSRSKRKLLIFGRDAFSVRVSGLPTLELTPRFWGRVLITTPDDLISSRAVLLRPTHDLSRIAERSGNLYLRVDNQNGPIAPRREFLGKAVWIGSEKNLDIPDHIHRSWKSTEASQWLPAVDMRRITRLEEGDRLTISIEKDTGEDYSAPITYSVGAIHDKRYWVEEIVVDRPRN